MPAAWSQICLRFAFALLAISCLGFLKQSNRTGSRPRHLSNMDIIMLKSATSTVALRTRVCTVCPHADGAELNWNGVNDPDAFICKQFCIRGDSHSAHTGTDRHESTDLLCTLVTPALAPIGHPRICHPRRETAPYSPEPCGDASRKP